MKRFVVPLIIAALFMPACAGNRAPQLVGESGLAIAQSIGQLQTMVKQLTDAKVITTDVALRSQEVLLRANDRVKQLPPLLRTIDKLQQANASAATPVEQAIAILQIVGQDISVVIAGVPIGDATAKLIDLVRASQLVVQTTLEQVSRLREEQ